MRIEDFQKLETEFENIPYGGVFKSNNNIYMRLDIDEDNLEGNAVDLKTGVIDRFLEETKVIHCPNAKVIDIS